MSHNKQVISKMFTKQRRLAVIFVAAGVVHLHISAQILAPTCTDVFEKLTFRIKEKKKWNPATKVQEQFSILIQKKPLNKTLIFFSDWVFQVTDFIFSWTFLSGKREKNVNTHLDWSSCWFSLWASCGDFWKSSERKTRMCVWFNATWSYDQVLTRPRGPALILHIHVRMYLCMWVLMISVNGFTCSDLN